MNKNYFVQYLPTKYPYLPVGDGFTFAHCLSFTVFRSRIIEIGFYEKEFVY
jgi:hypothetical protein